MTSAELITELQAARPAADAALRERVRTIAATERARRPSALERLSRYAPRRVALVAVPATAVVLLGVAGIAGLLDPASSPRSDALTRESAGQAVAPPSTTETPQLKAGVAGADAATAAAPDATTPSPTTGRAQRYSAQLTLSVKDLDTLSSATQEALRITRELGGYVVTVSYATAESGAASLTLKVPTAGVQDAVVRLSGLGTIVSQQIQIDDLQGQVDDLDRREAQLREQIARLTARLASSDLDAATRATLEARRATARTELARAREARAQVRAEARFATIQLALRTSEASVVPAVPSRWDDALDRAVEILALEAMIVLFALVLLGPLVLLAGLAWLGRRGLRRRQDAQLLAAP